MLTQNDTDAMQSLLKLLTLNTGRDGSPSYSVSEGLALQIELSEAFCHLEQLDWL